MNVEEFRQYLIKKENIYPDYCKKENVIYKNCEIYSPEFNNKYIGMPIFYLVNKEDKIISCNKQEALEILKLLEKTTHED